MAAPIGLRTRELPHDLLQGSVQPSQHALRRPQPEQIEKEPDPLLGMQPEHREPCAGEPEVEIARKLDVCSTAAETDNSRHTRLAHV